MTILTCNIRYSGADDGDNSWPYRHETCADVILSRAPDIICFQEMWADQHAFFSSLLASYASYGMIDTPLGHDPMNSIFYRSDKYTCLSAGGYWLSENPHITGSSSWDSACIRLANWVRLKARDCGGEFRVINTHLDHVSQAAREMQALRIVEDTDAYPASYPQILTGDMNCDTTNAAITQLRNGGWRDTYAAIHGATDPGHTYHAFQGPRHETTIGKMDWIFVRGALETRDAEIIADTRDGRYPSDHYFVGASCVFCRKATGKFPVSMQIDKGT